MDRNEWFGVVFPCINCKFHTLLLSIVLSLQSLQVKLNHLFDIYLEVSLMHLGVNFEAWMKAKNFEL